MKRITVEASEKYRGFQKIKYRGFQKIVLQKGNLGNCKVFNGGKELIIRSGIYGSEPTFLTREEAKELAEYLLTFSNTGSLF